jgi:DNA (cytosine-5)-methyltransferase 1
LLDLFCGAGGASVGYHRAGFEVVGVDIRPQPNYPFEAYESDALDVLRIYAKRSAWEELPFDAIHASPPCQAYSETQRLHGNEYPKLIEPLRELLRATGLPYVIENVRGAPLVNPVILCGSSFGLAVKRHRLFECDGFWLLAPPCQHPAEAKYPTHARKDKAQLSPFVHIYGTGGGAGKDINLWRWAMDVPWMQTKAEIAEAIPPAYTEFIGTQLLAHLKVGA